MNEQDPSNVVYTPVSKRGEVDPNDVVRGRGEWKKRVVPIPGGEDVVYTP